MSDDNTLSSSLPSGFHRDAKWRVRYLYSLNVAAPPKVKEDEEASLAEEPELPTPIPIPRAPERAEDVPWVPPSGASSSVSGSKLSGAQSLKRSWSPSIVDGGMSSPTSTENAQELEARRRRSTGMIAQARQAGPTPGSHPRTASRASNASTASSSVSDRRSKLPPSSMPQELSSPPLPKYYQLAEYSSGTQSNPPSRPRSTSHSGRQSSVTDFTSDRDSGEEPTADDQSEDMDVFGTLKEFEQDIKAEAEATRGKEVRSLRAKTSRKLQGYGIPRTTSQTSESDQESASDWSSSKEKPPFTPSSPPNAFKPLGAVPVLDEQSPQLKSGARNRHNEPPPLLLRQTAHRREIPTKAQPSPEKLERSLHFKPTRPTPVHYHDTSLRRHTLPARTLLQQQSPIKTTADRLRYTAEPDIFGMDSYQSESRSSRGSMTSVDSERSESGTSGQESRKLSRNVSSCATDDESEGGDQITPLMPARMGKPTAYSHTGARRHTHAGVVGAPSRQGIPIPQSTVTSEIDRWRVEAESKGGFIPPHVVAKREGRGRIHVQGPQTTR